MADHSAEGGMPLHAKIHGAITSATVAYDIAPHRALRAVVELHAPHEGRCPICVEWCDCLDDVAGGDAIEAGNAALRCMHGNVPAPCSTIQVIAEALGVKDEPLIEKEGPNNG